MIKEIKEKNITIRINANYRGTEKNIIFYSLFNV